MPSPIRIWNSPIWGTHHPTSERSVNRGGWADCMHGLSGLYPKTRCELTTVIVNKAKINTTLNNNYAKAVACHELGHAVGLRHEAGASASLLVHGQSARSREAQS